MALGACHGAAKLPSNPANVRQQPLHEPLAFRRAVERATPRPEASHDAIDTTVRSSRARCLAAPMLVGEVDATPMNSASSAGAVADDLQGPGWGAQGRRCCTALCWIVFTACTLEFFMLAVSDFLPSSLNDNIRLFSYNGHILPNAPLTCWVFDIMHALQLVVQGVICAAAAYVLRYRARFPSYFASPGRRILGSGSTPTCLFRGAGLASDSKHTFERKWARRGLAGAALSTFLAFVSNALSQ